MLLNEVVIIDEGIDISYYFKSIDITGVIEMNLQLFSANKYSFSHFVLTAPINK